jgi:HK97 family phage major capsid protein
MADEKDVTLQQLEVVEKGVKDFTAKAESFDKKATEIQKSVEEVKNTVTVFENTVNSLKEWKVSKDEADKKNQEALDKLIGRQKDIQLSGEKLKSFGELLKEGITENVDNLNKFLRKEIKSFDFQFKAVADMAFSTHFGTASQSTAMFRPGIIQNPNRKVHIRDLVPQGQMSGSTFYYMKENGAGEGTIATVSEGATKPQIDLDLVEASAPAEYIAGWLRISNKMLDDVTGLTAFLQSRLLEKLLVAEDAQLLNGDGTAPNISGITDTGNFTAASGAATIDVEQLVQAISQLEELDREATGIVLRPSDLPGIVTMSPEGVLRIAGVPVSRTTAMTVDKFIVGDFNQGAMLLIREAPRVEFFREDGTNVRENKVTVRVEERVAFPIFGSNYFIYGDFGNVA